MDTIQKQGFRVQCAYTVLDYRVLLLNVEKQGAAAMPHSAMLAESERAYHADPNNEETCRHLIAGYITVGKRDEALKLCLELDERLQAAGKPMTEATRQLLNSLTASPNSLPRPGISRRRMLQAVTLGSVFGLSAGSWQWGHRPTQAVVPMRSVQSWNEEGNRCYREAIDLYQSGQYRIASEKASWAIECFHRTHEGTGEAGVTVLYGEIEQARGNIRFAQSCFVQGLMLSRKHSKPEAIAHALELNGGLAIKQGRYADARKFLLESQDLSWKPNAKGKPDRANLSSISANLGNLAAETGQIAEAGHCYFLAHEFARDVNDTSMNTCLDMLDGTLSLNRGYIQVAEELLLIAKSHWDNEPKAALRWRAATSNRLAAVYLVQQNVEAVQNYLAVSLPIYERVGDQLGIADTQLLRGRLFLMQGKLEAAETELQAALTFFEREELLPRAARCRLILSALRTAQNRMPESCTERQKGEKLLTLTQTVLSQTERTALLSGILD